MLIRRGFICIFFLCVSNLYGQAAKIETPPYYLIFKVSDLSFDENPTRISEFLLNSYGLGEQLESFTLDFPSLTYRLVDGWNFHQYAGLEAEIIYYDEYNVNITTTAGESFIIRRQSYAAGLSVFARYPVLKNLDLYAKGGFSYWRTDSKRRGGSENLPNKIHEDKVQPTFGMGLRYALTQSILVDLSVEKTQVDGLDVDTISIGLGFRY